MLRERRRHANFKPNRKLDRKSSRGMIYENEELRLRTININAEVERGQSDIKKLRRENYQLRKEIWTLRDEYDRLGKLLKNKVDSTISDHSADCEFGDGCRCCDCCLDEDNDSCDMCNQNGQCNKNYDDRTLTKSMNGDKAHGGYDATTSNKFNQTSMPKPVRNDKIDMNFDHLSVVSEECLSNSDDQSNNKPDSKNDPIEGIDENIYTNFQSTIPPLEHFENLIYKDIGPNVDSLGEIRFNGEMYQASEPTPPPPTPPPLPNSNSNRKSSSLPLPPPPTMTEDGKIVQDNSTERESPTVEKPKYFFSALKSKRKLSSSSSSTDGKGEMRPDVLLVNNIVPSENARLATIRKPHNPLKYPSNSNAASMDPDTTGELDVILQDIQGLSRGIETMQMHKNATYENLKRAKSSTSSDSDQQHPYRTEMSLVLSYNGNKSKYSTSQNSDKTQSSDIETPPPNLPHAMKLLPNKLTYTGKNDLFKPIDTSQVAEKSNEHTENSANERVLTKSQAVSLELSNGNNKKANGRKNEKSNSKNDENHEPESNEDVTNANSRRHDDSNSQLTVNESNDAQESKEIEDRPKSCNSSENAKDSKSRRVSIQFNGIPMAKETETELHSNDSDINTTAEMVAEELVSAAISCRRSSRRFSCSRKLEDGLGSFLYPPSPFGFVGSHKRGARRTSFLSRRHSDGLIPNNPNQYNVDYESSKKNPGRNHCHRNHTHHNHQLNSEHCGNNIGESTGTSICNSITSSRESLASMSQQSSSRRKISITSHSKSSGKIPWCACWGNGCI